MTLYRGPMITAVALTAGAIAWAVGTWRGAEQRHVQQLERHTATLASSVSFLARSCGGAASPGAVAEAFRTRLVLRPPFRYAIVESAGWPVTSIGDVPPAEAPADPTLLVIRTPVMAGATSASGTGELPWEWRHDRSDARAVPSWVDSTEPASGDLVLVAGLERRPPPDVVRRELGALAFDLGLALVGVGVLVFTWVRSIRARVLEAALDGERRRRAQLEELSLVAAGLAHETKNPLGIILGLAERIADDTSARGESRKMAEQIVDAADRAAVRLGEFIAFARLGAPQLAPVSARALTERVRSVLAPELEGAGLELELDVDDVSIELDARMVEQVLVNLLLNSIQASEAGGELVLAVKRREGRAELSLRDHGRGIPAELLPKIYQPYVTGRHDGHGLGLAIVKRIVEQHGWTIETTSVLGEGTTTTIAGLRVVDVGTSAEVAR